jgi:hypothetical protein
MECNLNVHLIQKTAVAWTLFGDSDVAVCAAEEYLSRLVPEQLRR